MRVLFFDCFSGISGDMTLGALLDLGLDKNLFLHELDKLNVQGFRVEIKKVVKSGITGTDVNVILDEDADHHHHAGGQDNDQDGIHQHDIYQDGIHQHQDDIHQHGIQKDDIHQDDQEHIPQDYAHIHNNDQKLSTHCKHEYTHHREHKGSHQHEHSRNLQDIENIINMSDLKPRVKATSIKVFREIARAEAKVHNKGINEIHFHEVGALDSIVDIVGACICLDMLDVERVYSSELHEGKGFVKCAHGLLPVPVPAVLEILADSKIPIITEDISFELVTPTGIGILKTIATSFGVMPPMSIEKTGYGMGKRETGRLNALRVIVGSLYHQDSIPNDEIATLETNIDNMSPEILGYTMEKLLDSGALDVYYTPIYMKKNRPSIMLTVIMKIEDEKRLSDIIFRETSTLGVRVSHTSRYCMDRELISVNTEYGDVRVKVATMGDIMKYAPEYEDCKNIALKTGLPINKIYELVKSITTGLGLN